MRMDTIALSLIPTFIAYVLIFFYLVKIKADIESKILEAEAVQGIYNDQEEEDATEVEYKKTLELS